MRSRSGEWKTNLDKMQKRLEEIKRLPADRPGVYLHLGCGPQIFPGWLNVDKYSSDRAVIKEDMQDLAPFEDRVSAIYSSHSLEHLPYRRARLAVFNWNKALKFGGELFLAIPDLEEIMSILLDPDIRGQLRDWYMYTLFGYQADPGRYSQSRRLDIPVDSGQFHCCGFTKATVRTLLEDNGFIVRELYNYDGWSTPSIWVEAFKNSDPPAKEEMLYG